ncbi:MAG TPA: PorV/PorQ family protein [Candidatus Eisenbacteria bacterium]|nr:PorV/PorQ family protein [Candidatus Eisenbacteria bacterium]
MTRTMKWILPAILLLAASHAFAGGLERIGTAGAQELRVPVGAASVALGGSTVAMGGGLANIFYNPASLASTDESEAMASWSSYLADADVNYIAVSTGLGSQGSLGLSVKVLNIGDITVTTEEAPEGTGEILTPNFAVIGLTYARRMTDRVLLGGTGTFINEKIADATARGFAIDLGVQYDTGWRGLRFGFAMKNVGPDMRFEGPDFEESIVVPGDDPSASPHVVRLRSASFELPSYLQIGAIYDLRFAEDRNLSVMGAFQGNNFNTDEYRLGAEFQLGEWLALRGGFTGQLVFDEEDRQDDYLYNVSYGAGLNFKLGATPFRFDWAGTAVGEFFDDNQQVTLHVAF